MDTTGFANSGRGTQPVCLCALRKRTALKWEAIIRKKKKNATNQGLVICVSLSQTETET